MPTSTLTTPQITGCRRLSLHMMTQINYADEFVGVPAGTAKPMRLLGAFQEAEPYLALPAHAFKLICWLVKQTQPQDWEQGSRPIAWPSARRQQEFLGLSPARIKALNRRLFEAGIFVMRDNEQGKRYGRRDKNGRILEAFGFDLSPLALRYDEFVRIAAEAGIEREHMRKLRRRVTLARRAVRQIEEMLLAYGPLPDIWPRLRVEVDNLVVSARQAPNSDRLALVAHALERRQAEAEQTLREVAAQATGVVETNPVGLENEPHIIATNLNLNLYQDTVIAAEESNQAEGAVPPIPPSSPSMTAEREFKLTAPQLLELAPRLAACVFGANPTWVDLVNAAEKYLRPELGVSATLWGEACRVMNREQAALALAIVSTKPAEHFTKGAGGYFAGMVRKAEAGELRLERTIWMLRGRKWGKGTSRTVN